MSELAIAAPQAPASQRPVAYWLLACCVMVFVMVVLGGMTRLTESGLSMVEWQVATVLPPMNEAEWQAMFEKYQQSPQYRKVNLGMTLAEFKGIFWLEFIHRLWGRTIGLVFLVPFLAFMARGMIDRKLAPKLAMIFLLGGLQGGMGWLMVASGLVDQPAVSHYRLAAHLLLAFLIFGLIQWIAMDLLAEERQRAADSPALSALRGRLKWLLAFIVVVVTSGAFVAGLRAGYIYNTFPLMDGRLVPVEWLALEPWWSNFLENIATVQFQHRVLAIALFVTVVWIWAKGRVAEMPARARSALASLPAMATAQVALGITTLLMVVPVSVATAHQAGALVLFALVLWALHELRPARA